MILNCKKKLSLTFLTNWNIDGGAINSGNTVMCLVRVATRGCVLLVFVFVTCLVSSCSPAQRVTKLADYAKGRICIGTNGRMSVPSNREHHYRNVRDRYTNCTYVDGNLELTWLQDDNMDLSFLKDIREVTGYVLISHVDIKRIVLPRLQIIRGRTLFKLSMHDGEYALIVTLSKMHNLEMPALRDILSGSVGLFNNFNLCHLKTIRWDEIITGPRAKHVYVYNFTEPERDCPQCHPTCKEGCWGEGSDNCQRFSKVFCSPQCHQGRCFGIEPRDCCHLFCAGGCTGPKQKDCLACQNFHDNGVCKQECPPMQRYNPITYSWEQNPEGKYAYGATCVKNCPEHLLKDNGACVRVCPPKKMAVNGECVICNGPCPKTCVVEATEVVHSNNIETFRDCTILEGDLIILEQTFNGFQHVYPNFTLGPRYSKMHVSQLEIFSTLKEVTGFINIQAAHDDFRNLSFFRNLEIIGGRQTTEFFSALYIVKTKLESLNLRSLKVIRAGSVSILENKNLCFAKDVDWQKILRSSLGTTLLQNNRPAKECIAAGLVCHDQCSSEGCWGLGPKECLSCRNYQLADMCVEDCNTNQGTYDAGNKICKLCDEECEHTCTGPGPGNCTKCKHVQDGPYCVAECPQRKYNDSGECRPCHENCVSGCSGPENTVGEHGCHVCEKAVLIGYVEPFTVKSCLSREETCPPQFYQEFSAPLEHGNDKLALVSCRQCDPRCKTCTNMGFHVSVCQECAHYRHKEHCEDQCPSEFFPDDVNRVCIPCADECRECYGPNSTDCKACRNYKILLNSNGTEFNCTTTCPPEKPYKYLTTDKDDPICTQESPGPLPAGNHDDNQYPAIIGGVLGCILLLGIFLAVFGYQCYQRAKSKENTVKMTMRMSGYEADEPLKPTNVKPNLAQLRIVKEAELRKGGILGYGAFGTVYKGVWVPEGENVKIPVAIKVLREGTGTNTNKEILEEAYIMASVEHPNLLQLLAVCMTSQMMLVTQLMPLGCLLDYVRNNKDKVGSKPLLNWCTQIAKGMAYLEERRLVHRDLAARNVLVQTPKCVKITDFGLAKLLDINEDEYKAAGGKMPIKWLALECIQHRIFTHKSDVWAFGVTVWELLTYGGRPYETIPAREVPDLLEKGERLPQPPICTIDVYMIMIKCWMLDAESRPSFKELADEFAKMARDPGRYLVIPGDKLMRLPSYTSQDEKELIRNLSVAVEGPEIIMDAEEYLQPKLRIENSTTGSATPPLPTPTKSVSDSRWTYDGSTQPPSPGISPHLRQNRPERKYAHLEAAVANSPNLRGRDSNNSRYSSDPLKLANKDLDEESMVNGLPGYPKPHDIIKGGDLRLQLPVDEDDYLMPSPHLNPNSSTYMDLIGDSKVADGVDGKLKDYSRYMPDFVPVTSRPVVAMDNPEYHIMNGNVPHGIDPAVVVVAGERPRRKNTSSEEDSDHEYYNDYERLQRELQPLNHRRNETTV